MSQHLNLNPEQFGQWKVVQTTVVISGSRMMLDILRLLRERKDRVRSICPLPTEAHPDYAVSERDENLQPNRSSRQVRNRRESTKKDRRECSSRFLQRIKQRDLCCMPQWHGAVENSLLPSPDQEWRLIQPVHLQRRCRATGHNNP